MKRFAKVLENSGCKVAETGRTVVSGTAPHGTGFKVINCNGFNWLYVNGRTVMLLDQTAAGIAKYLLNW